MIHRHLWKVSRKRVSAFGRRLICRQGGQRAAESCPHGIIIVTDALEQRGITRGFCNQDPTAARLQPRQACQGKGPWGYVVLSRGIGIVFADEIEAQDCGGRSSILARINLPPPRRNAFAEAVSRGLIAMTSWPWQRSRIA